MQQVICECGNKVEVSSTQTKPEHRCPRCGRRVFANEADAESVFQFSMDDVQPQPMPTENRQQTRKMGYAPVAQDDIAPDLDATVILAAPGPTHVKPTEAESAVQRESPTMTADDDDDFAVDYQQPADDDSNLNTPSGSGAKYDLTKRVMRAIAKPVAPAVPYSGTGEYGIHRILRVHQRGGMGRILVGYDQYLKREVAIKELHPDVAEDESIVRRFIGEAEITAQLEHPGVVPIHRIGQGGDGLPYYTMKMIKGETLQDAIKAYHRKPRKPEFLNLVRRLVSVSKTIAFAHSKGVIHRDLKPANVMLGEHGETLVMDWGLAKPYNQGVEDSYISIIHQTKQSRPELTMVGAIVGTPAFMSPEQANAEEAMVGPLSDVFSLGTILYYLLAGQTAFSGRSTQEVLSKVRACNPTPPSQIKPNVPHGLEMICLKAMAKMPANRYQGATEFLDDLCRWLDDEPIRAEKDTFFSKIRRKMTQSRYSLLLVIPFVLVLSLILSCIGVWVVENNRSHTTNIVPHEEIPVEFRENVLVKQSPGIEIWTKHRHSEGLSLTCHINAADSGEHHTLLIYAPAGAPWNLSERHFLTFSLLETHSADNASLHNFVVRLRNGESYYGYKLDEKFWESRNDSSSGHHFEIPLQGSHEHWDQVIHGEPKLTNIEQMEIYFDTHSEMMLIFDNINFRGETPGT